MPEGFSEGERERAREIGQNIPAVIAAGSSPTSIPVIPQPQSFVQFVLKLSPSPSDSLDFIPDWLFLRCGVGAGWSARHVWCAAARPQPSQLNQPPRPRTEPLLSPVPSPSSLHFSRRQKKPPHTHSYLPDNLLSLNCSRVDTLPSLPTASRAASSPPCPEVLNTAIAIHLQSLIVVQPREFSQTSHCRQLTHSFNPHQKCLTTLAEHLTKSTTVTTHLRLRPLRSSANSPLPPVLLPLIQWHTVHHRRQIRSAPCVAFAAHPTFANCRTVVPSRTTYRVDSRLLPNQRNRSQSLSSLV